MNAFTISLTRAQLEAERPKIADNHDVHLVGDYGTASAYGVDLEFHFVDNAPGPGTLMFSVKSKPFYVEESTIESKVRGWFKT